jgi:hypothetical protein
MEVFPSQKPGDCALIQESTSNTIHKRIFKIEPFRLAQNMGLFGQYLQFPAIGGFKQDRDCRRAAL